MILDHVYTTLPNPPFSDDDKQAVAMQVNALRMTPFMPCRISEQPVEDLDRMFQELVEPIQSVDTLASRVPLKQILEERFSVPDIAIRIRRKVKVHIPYLGRDEEIPYAYQNGRLNLIAPVTFPKSQPALEERASKYALEGQSLFESRDILFDRFRRIPCKSRWREIHDYSEAVHRI